MASVMGTCVDAPGFRTSQTGNATQSGAPCLPATRNAGIRSPLLPAG